MEFLDDDGLVALWGDIEELNSQGVEAVREELADATTYETRYSDGTDAGPIATLTAEGHAEQATTTGKNLLPNTATSQTINGVTFTVNADGSVTANGTASSNAQFRLYTNLKLKIGTYVLRGCPDGGGSSSYELRIYDGTNSYRDYGSNGVDRDFTLSADTTFPSSEIIIRSGKTISNRTFYPQLELGSTATPYEPYTGGAPSPSPDYPQPIVTVRGRNLLDPSKNLESKYINAQAHQISTSEKSNVYDYIDVDGAETVTLSYDYNTLQSTNSREYGFYDSNGVCVASSGYAPANAKQWHIDVPNNAKYFSFCYDKNIYDIQLTEGSTTQPYVPYGYVGLDVYDGSTHLSTTPIPLPSRGWVAGLPDGTADELSVDGAGKVTWTEKTEEVVFDGSVDEGWYYSLTRDYINIIFPDMAIQPAQYIDFNGLATHYTGTKSSAEAGWQAKPTGSIGTRGTTDYLCIKDTRFTSAEDFAEWLTTHPVTVLYPLATPVIEDMGRVELPEVPYGATISIPELDALGVEYKVTLKRALQEVEDAVVELAADMVDVEQRLDEMGSIRRNPDGYYDNASVTNFLARRFDGKVYGYSEPKTEATEVTKTGANAGIPNPTLGTITIKGESAYRYLGPFQWHAAKGYVDADGVPHVKVIRGVDSERDWEACTDNVWSLRPVVYYSVDDSGVSVSGLVSDTWHQGLKPNPRAYLPDGTLRPYMLAARHGLGFEGTEGVSKPGLKGYGRNVSHNSLITQLKCATTGYSGKTEYEQWYENFMLRMIYGKKDSQGVMKGCTSYDLHYHPTVAETGVKRVILSNANAANLLVGSTMMMGNQATASNDRNNANCYNVFDGLVISSIETYDSANKAVYLDTEDTFDTDPAYLLSTAPWHTGSCGDMDWDGTPTAAGKTSGKEPMLFQGCELMNGNYDVLGDVILSSDGETGWIPYVNEDTKNESTSLTSDYVSCVTSLPVDDSDSWKYPLYLSERNGLMYGIQTGGSQTVGVCDGHYTNKRATTGLREWLSLGCLYNGGLAGFACVSGSNVLSYPYWSIWSRLSGVGRSKLSA